MKDLNMDQLSNQYFDVLKELGNIGAGNATTALAQLINCKVDMSVPQVKLLDFQELGDIVGGDEQIMVGIYFQVSGDIEGSMMFILSQYAAAHLVNKLMCGMLGIEEEVKDEYEFGEMECSAIKEVGNIITGAYLNALSGLTNLKIVPSIPQLGIDMAGALLSVPAVEFGILGDKILLIETQFSDDVELDGYFIMIPEMESYAKILESLGVM
ncbi:chemotaxis protein CheC [Parablautia intestinalis]|jgi:chemotaxis protein CheC|uniref:chemotaxis protein CheC n=1 Tax=Parablautia intestinalis TaxID=2320100 RepID=UPI00256EA011|nr:chemotaxis protein CheC [Parablautia intestinalis]MCI8614285.1 chemotaxis protein CheC [Lachnospiraceae bacterium]